jgi:hypothetical protein
MKRFIVVIIALGATLLSACRGGGSTTGPSAGPAPITGLTVMNELGTEGTMSVDGATVTVDGVTKTVSGGRVDFGTDIRGHNVDIAKRGHFLTRNTMVTSEVLGLLESTDPDYERQLVYHQWSGGRLMYARLDREYTWSGDASFQANEDAMQNLRESMEEAQRMSRGRVRFREVASGGDIIHHFSPGDARLGGNAAICDFHVSGGYIVGADILYARLDWAAAFNIPAHEVGHFFGLGHSKDTRDIMNVTGRDYNRIAFSLREELTFVKMTKRRVGQTFEDDDRTAGAAGIASGSLTIICPRPR